MKRVYFSKDAHSGKTVIPSGEYTVSVRSDTRQIRLEGNGRDIEVNAIGRPNKRTVRSLDVQFSPAGGGDNWSLVVKTPKMGEFFATVTYDSKKRH